MESQAAGEEIRIAAPQHGRAWLDCGRDFWLFDAGTPEAFAVLLEYNNDGRFLGAKLVTDPRYTRCLEPSVTWRLAYSVPLNEYLAGKAARAA